MRCVNPFIQWPSVDDSRDTFVPYPHGVSDSLFESILNFRDLGGLDAGSAGMVRPGRLFRSAALQWATPADLDMLRQIGIQVVVDLRTEREMSEFGVADVDAIDAEFHHLPVLRTTWHGRIFENVDDHARFLADRSMEMLHEGSGEIAKALHVFARPDALPAVFHCAAGKDRTGVLAAVVLGCLGVSDDVIADDYHATAAAMPEFKEWMQARMSAERRESMVQQPAAFLECPADAMRQFLDRTRAQHGTMADWAQEHGVGIDVINALRANLLV
jgi:protein-tyrosine phosphatase